MTNLAHAQDALSKIQLALGQTTSPDFAVVLGSGMGSFVSMLEDSKNISFSDIPHFPTPSVQGHHGKCHLGTIGNKHVLVFAGRAHYYEGHSLETVTLPIRVCGLWKIKNLVVTNASGGIRQDLTPGTLTFIQDQINFTGVSALRGPNVSTLGERFTDMSQPYDLSFIEHGHKVAQSLGIKTSQGVYIGVSGPTYETPAEILAYRTLGADLVGMSTVHEVITARHQGMRVLGISLVSNQAAGLSQGAKIHHQEVLEQSKNSEADFCKLLAEWIRTVA